ncbi:hypothetical protein ACFSJW_07515 [Flavobacterium artemisiae]|uniref:Uncharacterized protein n=1 Tax=Flavobacterium artemisiae TaxID=2126556 RepID=A0ABW4HC75_9FLAO
MKNITMSTALGKNKKVFLALFFFLICILLFAFTRLNKSKVFSVHLSDNQSGQALVFVPNSFLEKLIIKKILQNDSPVCDFKIYDFLSLEHKSTIGKKKTFRLALLKKSNFDSSDLTLSEKDLINSVRKNYAPENIIYKDIVLENNDMDLKLSTTNDTNQLFVIYQINLKPVCMSLKDENINITQKDLKSILYSDKGITANFSTIQEQVIREQIKYFESKAEYQNLGISVSFPFSFISSVTQSSKIYFYSGNPLLKNTYIKKMTIQKTSDHKVIKGTFEIDNDNPFLFPTALKGNCNLTTSQNKVISFDNFTFEHHNLSISEISRMNSLVKLCQDSIVPKLTNKRLVPTLDNSNLIINLPHIEMTNSIENSSISYFKENIIYKVNLNP